MRNGEKIVIKKIRTWFYCLMKTVEQTIKRFAIFYDFSTKDYSILNSSVEGRNFDYKFKGFERTLVWV